MHLSNREKNTIFLGSVLVTMFLVIQFIYLPLLDRKKELVRILGVEQDALRQMTQLQQQFQDLTRNLDLDQKILAARPPGFTLFSFLDSQAEKSRIKKNIDYMRPITQNMDDGPYSISKVRLKLTDLYLKAFVDFIQGVETSGNGVHVISLSLSRTGEQTNLLEAVLEARTMVPKEPR